jgi:peptidoglycan/xylan/chitin deacetylase (PgdA/CDA1 family)
VTEVVGRIPAVAYHSVTTDWTHPLAVTPERFRHQLTILQSRGFRGVTLAASVSTSSSEKVIAITFDDAFRTVYRHAAPILADFGWQATVFPVTDAVEQRLPMRWLVPSAPDSALEPLTWGELGELAAAGWEIGSHSCTHRLLSSLFDEEMCEELRRSREAIVDRFGRCDSVSYPLGEVDRRVQDATRATGYAFGSGLAGRFIQGNPFAVPRLAISGDDGWIRYRLKMSRAFWRARGSVLWDRLQTVRSAQAAPVARRGIGDGDS